MNKITITAIFNGGNSNIAHINTENMATIAYRISEFESVIKKPIMANYAFFAVVTFSKINSFTYINSIVIQHL